MRRRQSLPPFAVRASQSVCDSHKTNNNTKTHTHVRLVDAHATAFWSPAVRIVCAALASRRAPVAGAHRHRQSWRARSGALWRCRGAYVLFSVVVLSAALRADDSDTYEYEMIIMLRFGAQMRNGFGSAYVAAYASECSASLEFGGGPVPAVLVCFFVGVIYELRRKFNATTRRYRYRCDRGGVHWFHYSREILFGWWTISICVGCIGGFAVLQRMDGARCFAGRRSGCVI